MSPAEVRLRQVPANGIELQVADLGEAPGAPAVVLLHGFPELWFSWRHQIGVLAAGGRHVIAPDLRGFGGSSAPPGPEGYDLDTLAQDVLGLLDALGHHEAVVVGHDWGAALAWHLALAHPDRVPVVVGMSVPLVPRSPAPPTPIMRRHLGEDFYIVWFQEPGVADAALARDVRRTLATTEVWGPEWAARDEPAPHPPAFLSEEEFATYVREFERTGFTGGLNWYRSLDRTWELTERLAGAKVEQPALFLTGSRDPVRAFMPAEAMQGVVTDLETVVVDGAGHWVQQERPEEVNAALLGFLGRRAPVG